MDQHELIGVPEQGVCLPRLQYGPTNGGKWRAHFQYKSFSTKAVRRLRDH